MGKVAGWSLPRLTRHGDRYMALFSNHSTRLLRVTLFGICLVVGGLALTARGVAIASAQPGAGTGLVATMAQADPVTADKIQPRTTPAGSAGVVDPDRAAVDHKTGELPNFKTLFATSPTINSVILAVSGVSLTLFLFYLLTMNTRSLMPHDFFASVSRLATDGRFEEAAQMCRNNRNIFVAPVLQRVLEHSGQEHGVLLSMIDSEGKRQAEVLWNRLSYLADIVNIAPMLGLLGTVSGMLAAFFVLPSQSASINSRLLSEAIGGAMSTTMFGLIVAITTLIFYSIIKARLTATLMEVEQAMHLVADQIHRASSKMEINAMKEGAAK
jgi:biopolymer transport protein ExbB